MKKILSLIVGVFFIITAGQASELAIEKQLVGIVGATSGTVKTETRELKPEYYQKQTQSTEQDVTL